jgi:hypothetical protein
MSQQDVQMAKAQVVQTKYQEELLKKPHVVGVGVGLCKRGGVSTGDVCLVVMVDQKVPKEQLAPEDRVPSELDGVCVDVQEVGRIVAQ